MGWANGGGESVGAGLRVRSRELSVAINGAKMRPRGREARWVKVEEQLS